MNRLNSILNNLKPSVPKQYLLFVAAVVWTFAGGMLLFRGFSVLKFNSRGILLEEAISIVFGVIFYIFMFSRISLKHITRIQNNPIERPCIFSFFNWRSYFLMSVMISFGVFLRISGLIPIVYLSVFYIAMGTPLFLSSVRFYAHAVKNLKSS
ncbi:MAG: hypothetical protein WCO28_11455 [Bacteroidota bacterium]|jgi:hypothetical protein